MNLRERFEAKVSPEPTSGCHLWTGAVDGKGYGRFKCGGRLEGAHRVAWRFVYGPVPPGMHVLHRCDVPGCVSIRHLFLGSNLDNVYDKLAKGRDHNTRKTHCAKGHPFSGENLRLRSSGERECRRCIQASQARYRARQRTT